MLLLFKRRILRYYNREDVDYTQGPVDPYEYHHCFITLAKLFGIMDIQKPLFWMHIIPVSVSISGALAAAICLISVTEYVKKHEVHLITECGTYVLIMFYKLLIVSRVFTCKKKYHHLFRALLEDFQYISARGIIYRDRFFENHLLTTQVCVLATILTGATAAGMSFWAFYSMIAFMIKHGKIDEDGNPRPLPYPFWLFDYDLNATPVYEILFVMSIFFTMLYSLTYMFTLVISITWVRQITSRADTISWHMQDLLIDIDPANNPEEAQHYAHVIEHRLREIIPMHHALFSLLDDYAAVYTKCLMYEQKITGPIICLTAYSAAEKFDEGEIQFLLLILCVGTIAVAAIPAFLSTFLLEKVQSVSDACWDTPFWNAGPSIRPYLLLMTQRSMRQLPIGFAGFEDVSLTTYANILTRAYSCFNMLRQRNF